MVHKCWYGSYSPDGWIGRGVILNETLTEILFKYDSKPYENHNDAIADAKEKVEAFQVT